MAKSIIKEIIIALLICLAIILLLGILLYEYAPMGKTIPNTVSYTTPEEIKQDLASSEDIDESKVIMTYEVDSTDLNNYKQVQNYKPGKANPFSSYEATGTNPTTGKSSGGEKQTNSPNNTSTSQPTQNNSNVAEETNTNTNINTNTNTSGGHFFQDKGTK